MALTINYDTKVIEVPQADLTLISGTLYELDTNQFRKDVMAILDDETHIWMDNAFVHNTEVTVAGTTFARTVEFINGYSIEFEDGQYTVRLTGSNNNVFDVQNGVLVQNQVQIIAQNSAGLINATLTSPEVAASVWSAARSDYMDPSTMGGWVNKLLSFAKWVSLK